MAFKIKNEKRVHIQVSHGTIADSYRIVISENSYMSHDDKKIICIPITKEQAQEICEGLRIELFEY